MALLARKPANYESLVSEIQAAGGKAIGISTDMTDPASVENAFATLHREMGGEGAKLAAAVYNVGGSFVKKPFLELSEEAFMTGMTANGYVRLKKSNLFALKASTSLLLCLSRLPRHIC